MDISIPAAGRTQQKRKRGELMAIEAVVRICPELKLSSFQYHDFVIHQHERQLLPLKTQNIGSLVYPENEKISNLVHFTCGID